jgi:hypothetical protein
MLDNDFMVYATLFALLGLIFVFQKTVSKYWQKRTRVVH